MAVQKSKKSRAKRNSRRNTSDIFKLPCLVTNKELNEVHIRHFITKSGWYKNKKILNVKEKNKKDNSNAIK
ncbi:MAG TPA: 50S ribosomal protein L32 [Candidatus Azoamicus sp. OHIO2]